VEKRSLARREQGMVEFTLLGGAGNARAPISGWKAARQRSLAVSRVALGRRGANQIFSLRPSSQLSPASNGEVGQNAVAD
jgi:hypothetical protein